MKLNLSKSIEVTCIKCGEACLMPLRYARRPICKPCRLKSKSEVNKVMANMKRRKLKPKEDALLNKQARALSRLINEKREK